MTADAMKQHAGPCPDLESIAAFLDGRLTGRARSDIVAHIADCDDCAFVLGEAAQIRPMREGPEWARWWDRFREPAVMWPSIGALAAAAVLAIAVGTGSLTRWRSGQPPELQALIAAVGADRTVEPRLSGFAYGPLRGPVRGAASETVSPDVRIAAATIEKDAAAHRTPQALRSLGLAYLVMGDVDRAVPALEEAAGQAAPDAQALSDLAAAYLVRASRTNQPQDVARALTMAERAVNANPASAEARFNRAFALERLSRPGDARQAWEEYLRLDGSSPWAGEARTHLGQLR